MKLVKRIAAVLMAVALCASLAACAGSDGSSSTAASSSSQSTASTEDSGTEASTEDSGSEGTETPAGGPSFEDRVTLYVTAFVSRGEADGRRTDPVSKYIEDSLNIDLELSGVIEADYPTQLSAMIAANDMPDIFMFSDVTKQYPMLMASNGLLNLEPYLNEYAANTVADPKGAVMLEAYRGPANSTDGNVWMWGMCKGSWDDGTAPTCGHYIRWDLYKEAGYPKLENYDEDLLDVMEALVALEPENSTGQKNYGCGAWFGNGQAWGEWVFTFGLGPQEGINLIETTGRTLGVSTIDSTPLETNQLTDTDSVFWRSVKFYNQANQRGLLDPDSFTQDSSVYEDKMKDGRYMFNVPGWMSVSANQEFSKVEGNERTFVSLPSLTADAEDRFGNMYKGERTYGVSAYTEYPERCVALLDFVSTYEFSRIAWNGMEGGNWNMVDGEPVPTDDYLLVTKDDAFGVETGTNVYHHFNGYGNGTVDPTTGVAIDLFQFSPKAVERKMNDTVKDFCDHYGQENQVDVYRAETPVTDAINLLSFAEPPEDLKNSINSLNAYVAKNVFKVVAAQSDAEFEQLRDEMIAGMQDHQVDQIFEHFYNDALSQSEQVEKLATMIAAAN
ncbi:MAG: hypothetical protein ACK5LX_03345 [Oscillospiraceae bacterium]